MSSAASAKALRVVLDTNVVLSALVFSRSRLVSLRYAWQGHQFVPLVCKQSVTELATVLGYSKFRIGVEEQQNLLADYLPYAEVHELQKPDGGTVQIPLCRDPKDQIFLDLAHSAKVDFLVTGDDDLLVLNDPNLQRPRFRILKPQDFMEFIAHPS